jgi:hypothetical protein
LPVKHGLAKTLKYALCPFILPFAVVCDTVTVFSDLFAMICVSISSFFHISWLIKGYLIRIKWRMPHVEQELLTLPEHLTSRRIEIHDRSLSCLCKKSLKIPNGKQNLYIEEEQTTQWSKEKVQKDK